MNNYGDIDTIQQFHTRKTLTVANRSLAENCAEEHDLIRRVADGDRQAFETLYQRYAPRLAAFLYPFLGQEALIDDVRNDVMLVVWQRAAEFRPTARLSTWIFGIARRKALKARVRRAQQVENLPTVGSAARDQDSPERRLLRQERARAVAQALATLPPHLRDVIIGRYYQAYSYPELAEHLGCSVSTLKDRMQHARRRLAVQLRREHAARAPSQHLGVCN